MSEHELTVIMQSLIAALTGFGAALILAPIVYKLLLKTNSRQTVSQYVPEHSAKQGTPTMGGLIIVLAVLVTMVVIGDSRTTFAGILFIWYAFIGLLDDFVIPRKFPPKRGLGWHVKLLLQVLPFVALWVLSPTTPFWILGLTGFVVLFAANAFNFADGMDGLAAGIGIILALALAAVPLIAGWANGASTQYDLSMVPVLVGLAFAFVPFLFLNAHPAKVFMGDVGSMPIGALLGLGILQGSVFRNPASPDLSLLWPLLPLLFVLLAEIVPGPLQIASAKLRKGKRLFPFSTPIHHGFQAAGWPETRVVALFVLVQFVVAATTLGLVFWTEAGVALTRGAR